jgi:hypothetical protein
MRTKDSVFVAVLFTAETDKIMRYTDEVGSTTCPFERRHFPYWLFLMQGEMVELCKWTVNLASLPAFRRNASTSHPNGFYTGG